MTDLWPDGVTFGAEAYTLADERERLAYEDEVADGLLSDPEYPYPDPFDGPLPSVQDGDERNES